MTTLATTVPTALMSHGSRIFWVMFAKNAPKLIFFAAPPPLRLDFFLPDPGRRLISIMRGYRSAGRAFVRRPFVAQRQWGASAAARSPRVRGLPARRRGPLDSRSDWPVRHAHAVD